MCSYTNSCCELLVFTLQNWLWIIYLFQTSGCTWMQHSKQPELRILWGNVPEPQKHVCVLSSSCFWICGVLFQKSCFLKNEKCLKLWVFVICFTGWHWGRCLFATCALNEVSLFYHIWKERFSIFVSNV